jgi:hypothetical protein
MRAAGPALSAAQRLRLRRLPPQALPRSRFRARKHLQPPVRANPCGGLHGELTRLNHPAPPARGRCDQARRSPRASNRGSPRLRLPPRRRQSPRRRRSLNPRPALPIPGVLFPVLLPRGIHTRVTRIRQAIPVFRPRGRDNTLSPVSPILPRLELARHPSAHRGQDRACLLTRLTPHRATRHPGRSPTPQDRTRHSRTDLPHRWCHRIPPSTRLSPGRPEGPARRCAGVASSS